ncbi:MAG TPA: Imm1 family immunity protein [Pseudonocardiaceae bacterium]|jgi:hypothetical protein|nr:Imm1 family immunity protein [Pseudonocardiaceae bacterium]
MTIVMNLVLTGNDHLDITDHHEPGPLLAALREVNGQSGADRTGGFMWLFRLGSSDDDPTLAVGVRGEIGALAWYLGNDELVPANGLNDDDADRYWTWFGHEFPLPRRSELPIDLVYRALAEWIGTHRRPTCVAWVAT